MSRVWDRLGSPSARSATVLGAVALASSAVSIAALLGWQTRTRRRRRRRLAREANAAAHDAPTHALPGVPQPHAPPTYDESLVREQLSRNYAFFGEEGMQHVRESFVIVVGAGGVGSWAALMLLRAGVGRLRLIDFDQVSLSSLNRHACATLADVGRPKVVCCQQFFAKIAPWAHVEACVRLFRAEDADELLHGHPTYIVDAIDNLDTKVELLKYCAEHNLRVFASMGAGAKADPSRIQISDISTTAEDPLARVVRRELRAAGLPPIPPPGSEDPKEKKQAIEAHCATAWTLPCVYSTEKSDTHLLPLPDEEFEKGAVKELAAFDDFRVRILPVLGPLPAMFGLAAATYILCDIAQYKLEPLAIKGRRKLYEKLFADLNVSESRFPSPPIDIRAPRDPSDVPPTYMPTPGAPPPPRVRIPFSVNDIGYIFEEIFRGRSVVPPHDTLAVGQLERWDPARPLDYDNVVLFTRPQAREHEKEVLATKRDPAEYWGPNVAAKVEQRRAEERRMAHWR
ncbi:hypothetical protein MCAP1_002794 [Malassezia caprae]|uniref:THIF-type NAD/FAD binding fold domain-containing protein n=1 Tax=Malassezia caprae TaxID=1381934 RepID=A0AAF0E6I3_9BASI|nr:hypothetical protein MCAP1_002794 [Malassezia caprae]